MRASDDEFGGSKPMPRIRTLIRTTGLSAIALMVAIGLMPATAGGSGTSFSPEPRKSTTEKNARWMSRLQDSILLSQLSLPGTHDSCALHDGLSFGFAKCQSWSLESQLQAGVRFIDIRCRHVGDRLLIYHGVIDQRMNFEEVRDVCQRFLREHPTECIVMSVKEESTPEKNSRPFQKTFADVTKVDDNLWHIAREIPQLGAVRSRIVLVDRVGTLGGIKWSGMKLQDKYQAPLEQKEKLIRDHFDKARRAESDKWFVNFCSGTVPRSFLTPKNYAIKSNEFALDFMRKHNGSESLRLGTVVMDFPSEELIERIVESNFLAKGRKAQHLSDQ